MNDSQFLVNIMPTPIAYTNSLVFREISNSKYPKGYQMWCDRHKGRGNILQSFRLVLKPGKWPSINGTYTMILRVSSLTNVQTQGKLCSYLSHTCTHNTYELCKAGFSSSKLRLSDPGLFAAFTSRVVHP